MLFGRTLDMLWNGKRREEKHLRQRKCAILRDNISREMERNKRRISLDLEVWKQIQYYNQYYKF